MRKAVAYLLTAVLALYGAFLSTPFIQTEALAQGEPPLVKQIGPDTISAGSPTFTLRLEGKKFVPGARVLFDGVPLESSRVPNANGKTLLAEVDAAQVATTGTHTVQAVNPDGMQSDSFTLTVVEQDSDISFQLLANALEENFGSDILIEVTGEGFEENVRGLIYGFVAVETIFISDTVLRMQIAEKDIRNSARVPIMVRNPGKKLSNTDILFVVPAPAELNGIEPLSIEVGDEDFELTVFGSNFKPDARIMVGGVVLEPTRQKQGRLEATVPAALRQQTGQLIVRILQEGVQSRDLVLLVTPSVEPFIATLAPVRIRQGNKKTIIDIVGANLGNKDIVLLDGEEAKVKRSTRRRLSVVIPPETASVLGLHTIQVRDEEDNTSDVVTFEVFPDVEVTTFVGGATDGFNRNDPCVTIEDALLRRPRRMVFGPDGLLYFTDQQNHVIRSINFETNEVCTIAGTGLAGYSDSNNPEGFEPTFSSPNGLVVAQDGTIFVSDNGANVIRRIVRGAGGITVDTFAGLNREIPNSDRQQKLNSTLVGISGFRNGAARESGFRRPDGMAIGPDGSIYVADALNHSIRRISQINGQVMVETIAGNGVPGFADGERTAARFNTPVALEFSLDGNLIFVADLNNNRIRVINLLTGLVSTLAGNGRSESADGPPGESSFVRPIGLALDIDGVVYVSELGADRIRRIGPDGNVSTLAGDINSKKPRDGPGVEATFKDPRGLLIDRARGILYVADYENFLIRRIALR